MMRAKQFPGLCFVLQGSSCDQGFDVYAVDNKVDGGDHIKPGIKFLFNFKPRNRAACRDGDMIVAVCGSKLCAVGGSYDHNLGIFPTEFLQFDLANWKSIRTSPDDFKPDKAPKPKGGKPNPVVFVHENRLYALAGIGHFNDPDPPAFEVYDPYDPYGPSWKPLEPPPYQDKGGEVINIHYLRGYKFVNATLYVALSSNLEPNIFFTYSVVHGEWKKIQVDKSDTILANLTLYGLYCDWKAREDFHGLMGFHLTGKKVLAHDLTAQVDESMITKDRDKVILPFDNGPVIEDDYPYHVVRGLDDTGKLGGSNYSTGFVAHLAGNVYCAVYIILANRKHNIHACTFEFNRKYKQGSESELMEAKVLGNADYSADGKWSFKYQWGKMESQSWRMKNYMLNRR